MNMVVTAELLSAFPLLKTLPDNILAELAKQATVNKFNRRGIVLSAGKKEDAVCFLFEGRLQGVDFTVDGREVGLYFVEPGDYCGELVVFDEGPQPEYVIALTPVVVVYVPAPALRTAMLRSAELVRKLGTRVAGRVRELTRQRSLLGLPNIEQRVCLQLFLLVPDKDKITLMNSVIENPPTHMEIAIMLNISRETVTRVFRTLQNQQIVKRDGPGKLEILDLRALKALADGDKTADNDTE
jgi:CRP-like cAMP-binding protein